MASAPSDDVVTLQKQLEETNARLARVEKEGQGAQTLIPADVQSVCLLHVAVAFSDKNTGKRLRYAGLNQDGDPLQDSDGKPVLTLDGNGPEVKVDVFGTGFIAGPERTRYHEPSRRRAVVEKRRNGRADQTGPAGADFDDPRLLSQRSALFQGRD